MNEEKLSREEDVSSINIMELLYKMLEKWHLFLIAIVVAIIVCIFITKYSTPLYEAKTTLLIKNNSNMMSNLSGNFGFNFYNQDIVNFQNEIGTIQSASMVKRTIKSLDLYVDYFQKSSFKTKKAEAHSLLPFLFFVICRARWIYSFAPRSTAES